MHIRKERYLLILFAGIVLAMALHIDMVLSVLEWIFNLIIPLGVGLLLAFILNAPISGLYRFITKHFFKPKDEKQEKILNWCCLLLVLAFIVFLIVLAVIMFIPALVDSAQSIGPLLSEKLPAFLDFLSQYGIDVSLAEKVISGIDFKELSANAGEILSSTIRVASVTISGLFNFVFGLVIGIYMLLSRHTLLRQVRMLMRAWLNDRVILKIDYVLNLIQTTYTKFLFGQCVEACILGFLIFITFAILQLPYAGLIGFLTALFAFVPYVGAFASCMIGAFLTLLADPGKVLICIIAYLVVQFVENQFIYPNVVGSSVGLAPLWTLVAALLGGNLFGLPGIIFFIPLTAVIFTIIRDATHRRLSLRKQ